MSTITQQGTPPLSDDGLESVEWEGPSTRTRSKTSTARSAPAKRQYSDEPGRTSRVQSTKQARISRDTLETRSDTACGGRSEDDSGGVSKSATGRNSAEVPCPAPAEDAVDPSDLRDKTMTLAGSIEADKTRLTIRAIAPPASVHNSSWKPYPHAIGISSIGTFIPSKRSEDGLRDDLREWVSRALWNLPKPPRDEARKQLDDHIATACTEEGRLEVAGLLVHQLAHSEKPLKAFKDAATYDISAHRTECEPIIHLSAKDELDVEIGWASIKWPGPKPDWQRLDKG